MIVYVCAFHKGWCNILLFSDIVEIIGCSDETDEFVAMFNFCNLSIIIVLGIVDIFDDDCVTGVSIDGRGLL